MAQPIRFRATVSEVMRHDPDVVTLRLLSEKRLPRFQPGQFIHLALDEFDPAGFWPESRVFSAANAVSDRKTVELTISRQGKFTSRILDEVAVGRSLWAKGPYGDFVIDGRHGCSRIALVAGGTGITPFCAFMDRALSEGRVFAESVTLYYGARTPDLLIYAPLVRRCVTEVPGFRARLYAEAGNSSDEAVHHGRLDAGEIVRDCGIEDVAFYVSGPKQMIDSFRARLTEEFKVDVHRVLIDAWG
ncbi:MAG TPA: FAD-dependent oxidoreductase [Thermoanaerobaculia bacterium]|nr:FAD-dependent oxidoreductase [Thermoanaerobaculia bacterium]